MIKEIQKHVVVFTPVLCVLMNVLLNVHCCLSYE